MEIVGWQNGTIQIASWSEFESDVFLFSRKGIMRLLVLNESSHSPTCWSSCAYPTIKCTYWFYFLFFFIHFIDLLLYLISTSCFMGTLSAEQTNGLNINLKCLYSALCFIFILDDKISHDSYLLWNISYASICLYIK